MSIIELMAVLKGWQPLLGAVFGFVALISGALFNAWLNRRRDDRLRALEANAVALSIYREITLLRYGLCEMADGVSAWVMRSRTTGDNIPSHYKDLFPRREPTLYRALSSKIGLMPADLLAPVTRFYTEYDVALQQFSNLFEEYGNALNYGPERFIGTAINAVADIEPALKKIAKIGMIPDPPVFHDQQPSQAALMLLAKN